MCRARFGILNDLHSDLISEGITDVDIIGINGFQYINDSVSCMICSDECSSSTCSEGPRILPWVQDYDDGINCSDENIDLCSANDEESDVWDLWDATLRDFVILDRYGIEFARVNLTYNNPDTSELCECSGNSQKIKDQETIKLEVVGTICETTDVMVKGAKIYKTVENGDFYFIDNESYLISNYLFFCSGSFELVS